MPRAQASESIAVRATPEAVRTYRRWSRYAQAVESDQLLCEVLAGALKRDTDRLRKLAERRGIEVPPADVEREGPVHRGWAGPLRPMSDMH